jgi:hypothetical protein
MVAGRTSVAAAPNSNPFAPARTRGGRSFMNITAQQTPAAPALPKASSEVGTKKAGEPTNAIDTEVCMVGWAVEGGKARVALSDGRWVGQEDGLTQVTWAPADIETDGGQCAVRQSEI